MICVCNNDINRAKSKVTCCKMIPSKCKQIIPTNTKISITNSNQPQDHSNTLFFLAGGQLPLCMYDMS